MKKQTFFTKLGLLAILATFVFSPVLGVVSDVLVKNAYAQTAFEAKDDTVTVESDKVTTISILTNDGPNPVASTGELVDQPKSGKVRVTISGELSYEPDSQWATIGDTDIFSYKVCDAANNCDTATVTVKIVEGSSNDDEGPKPETQQDPEIKTPCSVGLLSFVTSGSSDLVCALGVFLIRDVWYGGTTAIAVLVGGAFDFFLFYTAQSSTYKNVDFILVGWGIVRDISNIILIAGLLFIAINMMLNNIWGSWKKTLSQLIIVALLVNFSLFFTQVVVDASHILARVFYNAISVNSEKANRTQFGSTKYLPLSEILINKMKPQRLLSGEIVNSGTASEAKYYFVIFIVAGLINVLMIGVFATVLFLMIGRTVQLMFSMIASPFAMASTVIPQLAGTKYAGFGTWFKDLVSTAFMLPVFLFFMYLIALFITLGDQARVATGLSTDNVSGFDLMTNIIIPVLLILGFLVGAKGAAKKMASEITTTVSGAVEKATKWAIGSAVAVGVLAAAAATGGATGAIGGKMIKGGTADIAAGRKALAKRGATAAEKAAAREQINRGRQQLARGKSLHRIQKKHFDVRNWKIGGVGISEIGKIAGIDVGKASTDTSTKESRDKAQKDKVEEQIKKDLADVNGPIHDEIDELKASIKDKEEKLKERKEDLEKEIQAETDKEISALGSRATVKDVEQAKARARAKATADSDAKVDPETGETYGKMKSDVKKVKGEIKNKEKEIIDVSKAVLEGHFEDMKKAFAGLGTALRDAIQNGISSVSLKDLNLNFQGVFSGYSEEIAKEIRDKIKRTL